MQKSFFVRACWDAEAKVFYSESDIRGLHIEADSLEEFEKILNAEAPGLIVNNHIERQSLAKASIADLIPSIIWQRPEASEYACA